MHGHHIITKPSIGAPAIAAALFGAIALLVAWATGGLSPSLTNPDEGAHYVNALFLGDWVRAGLPSPMPFARDFYAHFPRLSIGHWPPGWYLLQTPLFATVRPSPWQALCLSAFVAGLPAGVIVWAFGRVGKPALGLATGLGYAAAPLVTDAARHILLDQPVALAVALAAVAWFRASERPTPVRLLLFGLLAAAATLIKGNGALIALAPAIDIALTGRWRLLRRPALWAAAAFALILTAPWYRLSFQISAGGFNYAPGLAYARLAVQANAQALHANLGAAGLLLAAIGVAATFRRDGGAEARLGKLAIAVVVATFAFQAAIPVALEPRYIAPALPWAYVLSGFGLLTLWSMRPVRLLAPALGLAALVPTAAALVAVPPKADPGAPGLARVITGAGGAWMVDARAGGEGAVIAAAAHADQGRRRVWVVRASQWLSTSDFMGRGYRLTATDAGQAREMLDRLGVAGVIALADRGRAAYPHSVVLARAVRAGGHTVSASHYPVGSGLVTLARRRAPVRPNAALLAGGSGSANLGKMRAALD